MIPCTLQTTTSSMQYNAVHMRRLCCTLLLVFGLLSACTPAGQTVTPVAVTQIPNQQTPTTEVTDSSPQSVVELHLWLAPEFDPENESPAGSMLQERLTTFEASHPGVSISVRIKEETGVGGLLQSLESASIAAPGVLPDVISLSPDALQAAAVSELLIPLDGLLETPSSPAWYDHTIAPSRIDGSSFGQPFASETEILAYRTFLFSTPPLTWSEVLAGPEPFLFPAGDPQATFTLAQYLALGGELQNDEGEPALDPITLTEVLSFYSSLQNSGTLSIATLQYVAAAETWDALLSERATSALAPLSALLLESDLRIYSAVPLPNQSEPGFGFSKTWSWAIVSDDPDQQNLATVLIEWLTRPQFIGPWTHALGMLPTTAQAMEQWPEGPETSLANGLITVMQPHPTSATLSLFGPPIREAVDAVIREGVTPSNAALDAAQSINAEQAE